MIPARARALVALLLSVMYTLSPSVGGAQQEGTLATRCEQATQAVRTSPIDALASGQWAAATVCGLDGGRVLAVALRAMSQEADTLKLQHAEAALSRIRDSELLGAAIAVATDATASPAVRAMALRVLAIQT